MSTEIVEYFKKNKYVNNFCATCRVTSPAPTLRREDDNTIILLFVHLHCICFNPTLLSVFDKHRLTRGNINLNQEKTYSDKLSQNRCKFESNEK